MSGTWQWALLLGLLVTPAVQGQTNASSRKAAQLYSQSTELHQARNHVAALAKIKAALALVPRSKVYLAYKAELEPLAARDAQERPALQADREAEASVERLAAHLAKAAKDDREKAQLIYRWITDRIAYDVESASANEVPLDDVLKKRVAHCESYASLYEKLGKQAGLEVVKIPGWAKGYGYVTGSKLDDLNSTHVWNAVKLDGQWQLVDCTWGAGTIMNKKFTKEHRDYYFLASPEEFIFTHFPADSQWQLTMPPISKEEFIQLPRVDMSLFRMGWKAADVRSQIKKAAASGIVQTGDTVPMRLTFRAAPLEGKLSAGTRYKFQVEAAGIDEMAVLMDGQMVPFTRKDTRFEGTVVARKGKLTLGVRPPHGKPRYYLFVLEYVVE